VSTTSLCGAEQRSRPVGFAESVSVGAADFRSLSPWPPRRSSFLTWKNHQITMSGIQNPAKKNGKKNKTMFSDITTDFIQKPSSTHGIM
jgi:hypothetical protein